jgi:hypothetical protein
VLVLLMHYLVLAEAQAVVPLPHALSAGAKWHLHCCTSICNLDGRLIACADHMQ